MDVEVIDATSQRFNGRVYHKYESQPYYKSGRRSLHRDVWSFHHGPIPPKHHVHHLDGDRDHNDIANLACMLDTDHLTYHGALPPSERKIAAGRANQHKMMEWHSSPEGIEWHRQHAHEVWARQTPASYTCQQCGKPFESMKHGARVRFCSNACKSAWRRASGVDLIEKPCGLCGTPFKSERHAKVRFCSKSCARKDFMAGIPPREHGPDGRFLPKAGG